MPENDKLAKNDLVAFRPGDMGDASFIFSTWLKGLRFGNDWYGLIESKAYFAAQHKIIESILSKTNTTVKVACLKEDPGVILGYAIFSGTKAHWVHIKKAWRKIGLMKDLMPSDITTVTHVTDTGRSILKRHNGVTFNPFNLE